jgi:hypothetical protein
VDEKFLSSVFATPPVILGRQLKPFCCGHAVVLAGLNSPFIIGGELTVVELYIAVWVCSHTYEELQVKFLKDTNSVSGEFAEFVSKSIDDCSFAATNIAFQSYLSEHLKAPDKWKRSDAKSAKAPWPLIIATRLMKELKFTEEKAWNMPMQMALWYFAAISEFNGDDSLITPLERERMAMAREKQTEGVLNG